MALTTQPPMILSAAGPALALSCARQQLLERVLHCTWHYEGLWQSPAHCHVQVVLPGLAAPLLVVTEAEDNPGTSVTNFADHLAAQLVTAFELRGPFRYVECYRTPLFDRPVPRFSAVTFLWDGWHFSAPLWSHIAAGSVDEVLAQIGRVPLAVRGAEAR